MAVDQKTQFESALLRRLHSLHLNIVDLESQLERGPRQIRAGEAIVNERQKIVDKSKEDVRLATIACDEKQLQLKSREDRIEELRTKLNSAASNKEFNLLKEQIAADEQANSVQSDEIFEGLERIDELNAKITEAEEELTAKQKEHQARVETVESRLSVVRNDLEHIRSELAKAEEQIPAAAKPEYMRVSESRKDESLAPVEDDSCGGCNQTLTTQMVDRIRLGFLTHCPACAAWLYNTD